MNINIFVRFICVKCAAMCMYVLACELRAEACQLFFGGCKDMSPSQWLSCIAFQRGGMKVIMRYLQPPAAGFFHTSLNSPASKLEIEI